MISLNNVLSNGLAESEQRYRDLFENANDLIQSVASDGTFIFVNPAWCDTLGYSKDEVGDLTIFDIVHADDHADCLAIFESVMKGTPVHDTHTRFITKLGETVFVEGSATCSIDNGERNASRAIFHNVTERVNAERSMRNAMEEAKRATQVKFRFLAAANHDLRQPLQSIGLYLATLERRSNDRILSEIIEKTRTSVGAMGELLDALLDISRLDSGSITPEPRTFPIQDLLDRIAVAYRPYADDKGLPLRIPRCDLCTHSDPGLLQRIVENLVGNAIRYTEKGTVSVLCKADNHQVSICVSDSGVGIAENELETIFEE